MRYDVTLSLGYRYAAPSGQARTILRLLPSNLPRRQTVLTRLLDIDPVPSQRRDAVDFFGNAMTLVAFDDPIMGFDVTLRARVERMAEASSLDLSPALPELASEIAAITRLDSGSPHHFLGASTRVGLVPAIGAFARDRTEGKATTKTAVEALGRAINAEMRFDSGATDVQTTPDEAFENRHGVCQDFSHVMISGLRALGIPAGYVSGFLRTDPPPGQPRLEGADAMHAWVSAWCGAELGWLEYDPTNACWVGLDHITVAYGRDYADVSPMKGVVRTAGHHQSRHAVDVVPLDMEGGIAKER